MKTLEQIKDEVCMEMNDGSNFAQTFLSNYYDTLSNQSEMVDEIAKRYAKQVSEDLKVRITEEAKVNWKDSGFNIDESRSKFWIDGSVVSVCKESINNAQIILL